ncbi:hypothetical protein [Amycolatopsis pigmentata]|uniref:Uncharacterized protein n=1 Tax=Amycolatopsis pigmentata TaxID=450801 RepID=A0ABW5G5V5_9PSEU
MSVPSEEPMPESVEEETPWAVDSEAPIPDAAEQRQEVTGRPGDAGTTPVPQVPLEADPADAIDQQRVVNNLDEEFQ